jgi:hypothetical protein
LVSLYLYAVWHGSHARPVWSLTWDPLQPNAVTH